MRSLTKISIISIIAIILAAPFFVIGANGEDVEADFSISEKNIKVDEEIKFDASPSQGEDLVYIWSFGDGEEDKGMIVNHSYGKAGEYHVVLVVSNSTGVVDTYSQKLIVEEKGGWLELVVIILLSICLPFAFIIPMYIGPILTVIFGAIWGFRIYEAAKKYDMMEESKPYLLTMLITIIVGFFFGWMLLIIPLIVVFITYKKYRTMMEEEGFDITKVSKKKTKGKRRKKQKF